MADTEILGRATVEFRAVATGQDTGDAGTIPEGTPLEGVRVRLTPSPRKVEVVAGGIDGVLPAKPTTFTLREWELVTDADGYLINPAAVVTTTEHPHGTPESLVEARTIEIVASDAIEGVSIQWTSVVDAPDSGVPAIAKVWLAPAGSIVDLTTVVSIPPSPDSLADYLQAVRDARAARDIAVASGAVASAAAERAEADAARAEQAAQEATAPTDEMVASLVTKSDSETGAAIAAAFVARRPMIIDLNAAPYSATPGSDITAALQAAIDAIAAGFVAGEISSGDIYIAPGEYLLNGAPSVGTALGYTWNGIITLPAVPWNDSENLPIRIRGSAPASSGAPNTGQANGTILRTERTGCYVIDTIPHTAKWDFAWTGIMPIFENLIVRVPAGGTAGGINVLPTLRARFSRVMVDTAANPPLAPTGSLFGIAGPHGWSNGDVTFRDVSIRWMPTAIRLTEHGVYDNVEIIGCETAFEVGEHSHTIYFQYVDVEQCHSVFHVPGGRSGIIYGHVDVEMAGVVNGAWNAPLYLLSPGSTSALTGALTLNIVGAPAGGLALGCPAPNLDLAVLYAESLDDRGGIRGWRGKHPIDIFKRLANLDITAGNPGLAWPTCHPWRLVAGSMTVSGGAMVGANPAGSARAMLPAVRESRRVSATVALGDSRNISVYANWPYGTGARGVEVRASGTSITLLIGTTTRATASGVITTGNHTIAADVILGHDGELALARAVLDDVVVATWELTADERALASIAMSTRYPPIEDGISTWQDSTSKIVKFWTRPLAATWPPIST